MRSTGLLSLILICVTLSGCGDDDGTSGKKDAGADAAVDPCQQLRTDWNAIVTPLPTSCVTSSDCLMGGQLQCYGSNEVSGRCSFGMQKAAYEASGAPALAAQYRAMNCSLRQEAFDCGGGRLECINGGCTVPPHNCPDFPLDAGRD